MQCVWMRKRERAFRDERERDGVVPGIEERDCQGQFPAGKGTWVRRCRGGVFGVKTVQRSAADKKLVSRAKPGPGRQAF